MAENLKQFCKTPEFLSLDPAQLASLLNSNFPVNMTEYDVFVATAAWIEHDLSGRLRWSEKLVDGVRLADIPTRDIATMLDRPGLKQIKVSSVQFLLALFWTQTNVPLCQQIARIKNHLCDTLTND